MTAAPLEDAIGAGRQQGAQGNAFPAVVADLADLGSSISGSARILRVAGAKRLDGAFPSRPSTG